MSRSLCACLGLAVASTSLVISGCGGSGSSSSSSSNAVTVRYINSVPDSVALDFRLNETVQKSATSVAYGGSSPNFVSTQPAIDDFDTLEHGQVQPLWSEADILQMGSDSLVIALGEEGFGAEYLKRPQLLVSPVDRTVPNGSKARLFIVNALIEAPGVPTPSIDFTNPGSNPTFTTGPNPIAPAGFQVMTIDSGSQEFIARQNNTNGSYVDKTFTFQSGGVYVMLVTGIVGGTNGPDMKQIQLQTK